jgi:hypothetical protein
MTNGTDDDKQPRLADPPVTWNELQQLQDQVRAMAIDMDKDLRAIFDTIFGGQQAAVKE